MTGPQAENFVAACQAVNQPASGYSESEAMALGDAYAIYKNAVATEKAAEPNWPDSDPRWGSYEFPHGAQEAWFNLRALTPEGKAEATERVAEETRKARKNAETRVMAWLKSNKPKLIVSRTVTQSNNSQDGSERAWGGSTLTTTYTNLTNQGLKIYTKMVDKLLAE